MALLVGLLAAVAVQSIFVAVYLPGIVASMGYGPDGVKLGGAIADALAFVLGIAVVAAEGRGSFHLKRRTNRSRAPMG